MPIERLGRRRTSNEAFLEAIANGAETLDQIAERLGYTRTGARLRLDALEAQGRVVSRVEPRPRVTSYGERGRWPVRAWHLPEDR